MSKITTILWDLDGTLVDSEYIHDEAVVHATKIMGWDFDISNMPPGLDGLAVFELVFILFLSLHGVYKNLCQQTLLRTVYVAESYRERACRLLDCAEALQYVVPSLITSVTVLL